jgi:hypothetical protein
VAIGSSRLLTGFQAEVADAQLRTHYPDRDFVVLDVGRSWRGNGQLHRQVKDLLEVHTPQVLLLEYNSDNGRNHGRFYEFAKTGDIFNDIKSRPSMPFPERLSLSMREFLRKNVFRLSERITNPDRFLHRDKPNDVKTNDCSTTGRDKVQLNMSRADKFPDWETKSRSWDVESPSEERNNYYIRKIVDLAASKDVTLAWVVVPTAFEGPLDPSVEAGFEARYGSPLYVTYDVDTLRDIISAGYSNATHMALPGRSLHTQTVIDAMVYDGLFEK